METVTTVWQKLKQTEKPIIMYGMGDGAEKIMKIMESLDIKPKEFMASDEFVRGHSFLGYEVKRLSEIQEMYEDFVIVVCFGSSLPSVTSRLYELAEKYELYAPDVPVVGEGVFDETYISEHGKELQKVRKMLADEKPKEVFDTLINYRLSGDINVLKSCETPLEEAEALLKIGKTETYVDLGAYNGDTVERFLKLTNICGGTGSPQLYKNGAPQLRFGQGNFPPDKRRGMERQCPAEIPQKRGTEQLRLQSVRQRTRGKDKRYNGG